MQTTISLKIDSGLVNQVKKAAKIRGISMSDYIRDRLQSSFRTNKAESITMFKYFGINKTDEQTEYFENKLKESKLEYNKEKSKDDFEYN